MHDLRRRGSPTLQLILGCSLQLMLGCSLALIVCGAASADDVPGEEEEDRILVGIDYAFPPVQWVDEHGEPRGMEVDLVRAVAELEGLSVEFRGGPWHEIRAQLERGEIDLVPGMVRTPERDELMEFSVPTLAGGHSIFVPSDSRIRSLADLEGATVAVELRSVADDLLPSRVPSVERVRVDTALDALQLVADGKADAAIALHLQGLYFIRENDLEGIRSVGRPVTRILARWAVPEARPELLAQLNDGLYTLQSNGVYDEILDRWYGVLQTRGPTESPAGRVLIGATGLIALLLLMALAWSRTLRRQVEARTRALRESEAEALRLERQLLQAQKMEALDRMAGGVAHDFHNILTTIIGNAGLALETLEPESPLARPLQAIERAGRSGADLTHQLLAFARGESVKARDLCWSEVVGDAKDMLQRLVGPRIALRFEAQPEPWPVRLDPGQALQIVMNLVINARDAIADAGTITIRAANASDADGDQVCLSVQDDGAGMDVATRQRIFEPFFTTKHGSKGTGLGLATVYGIARRRGGRVAVESELGAGSTFHVWLPKAPDTLPTEAPPATPALEVNTVLVVEDDADVREIARLELSSLGYEVVEASDGETALELLHEKSDIGLLATDLGLPGLSGAELAQRALEQRPDLAVLFVSGRTQELELPSGARFGYLPKPYSRDDLAEALNELTGRSS